ncbi:photolyase/cryptochrome alpha/beta domain-containing protein, partial [Haematococcus lacustris]
MATPVKSTGTKSDGAVAIAWFRKDLRLHDNAMLEAASRHPALLPVYILDPQDFQARQGAEQLQG